MLAPTVDGVGRPSFSPNSVVQHPRQIVCFLGSDCLTSMGWPVVARWTSVVLAGGGGLVCNGGLRCLHPFCVSLSRALLLYLSFLGLLGYCLIFNVLSGYFRASGCNGFCL